MTDVSVLITARNEQFLPHTIQSVIENKRANTNVIVVCDGYIPDSPLVEHNDVHVVYLPESIGQRAAINLAARESNAKYIIKLDAHCAVDEGFDVKLMADCEDDWTVIPTMFNLHAFDWMCLKCGNRTYQGGKLTNCEKCQHTEFEQVIVFKPRLSRRSDFARFDRDLHFQYWGEYRKRPESKGDIADVMCFVGACFFMHRDRYWELGGLDEATGSWGQMGVEISCKSWLSGGRMVVNKKTWFSHLFRTQPGFGFPYPMSGNAQEKARIYSRWMWMGNNWSGQKYPLSWMLEKFKPPDWTDEDIEKLKSVSIKNPKKSVELGPTKGIVYFTDNRLDPDIFKTVQTQIKRSGLDIVSVSLQPLDFGRNLVLNENRGILALTKQILAGLEASTADIIFLNEHDVWYAKEHYSFAPPDRTKIYYNTNVWHLRTSDGHAVTFNAKRVSQLCAYRDILVEHYRKRLKRIETEGFSMRIGHEPGSHHRKERIDDLQSDTWATIIPNIDIKHGQNLTPARWKVESFRDQRNCTGWREDDAIPYWGITKNRFPEFLNDVALGKIPC